MSGAYLIAAEIADEFVAFCIDLWWSSFGRFVRDFDFDAGRAM